MVEAAKKDEQTRDEKAQEAKATKADAAEQKVREEEAQQAGLERGVDLSEPAPIEDHEEDVEGKDKEVGIDGESPVTPNNPLPKAVIT